jgi:protein FAM50
MASYKGNSQEAIRAMQLQKRRQQQQEEVELKKKKIEEENRMTSIDNKFKAHYDAVEQLLKTDTIGLVTLEDMKKKREQIIQQREQQLAKERRAKLEEEQERKEKKERQKNAIQKLSFANDLDEDEEGEEEDHEDNHQDKSKDADKLDSTNENSQDSSENNEEKPNSQTENNLSETDEKGTSSSSFKIKKRFGKNPTVDTSFLPDKEREAEENDLREKLRQQWVEQQSKLKNEDIEITYSYWDGSGHRRTITLKKGNTIQQFLYKCLEQLRGENQFNELKVTSVDQLMYVKEDIILPHHYSFYDLIVTKARGKSGPLFIFDCHEDIRMQNDASIEKEESHAGKVVLRSWYERHKHIFPASRWEVYDPEKKWDKPYSVKDKK